MTLCSGIKAHLSTLFIHLLNKIYHNVRKFIVILYNLCDKIQHISTEINMNDSPLIKEINSLPPIHKALRLVGAVNLAQELGLTRAAVYSWVRKNKIPANHVLKIEQLSGISRYDLAPEIFGVAQK
jgi:hypothetical protein